MNKQSFSSAFARWMAPALIACAAFAGTMGVSSVASARGRAVFAAHGPRVFAHGPRVVVGAPVYGGYGYGYGYGAPAWGPGYGWSSPGVVVRPGLGYGGYRGGPGWGVRGGGFHGGGFHGARGGHRR